MEKSQGNSFIPKSPVRGTVKPRSIRKIYILTYLVYILFFGTCLAALGVFAYGITKDSQLASERGRLTAERELFNQSDLERVRELESRMNAAFTILDRHVSLYSVLIALEDTTVQPVQIDGFEYVKGIDNSLNLSLTARTENYNNALFQREIFKSNSIFVNASTSEIAFTGAVSTNGLTTVAEEVQFTVSKKLSVSEFPYVAGAYPQADSFTPLESDDTLEDGGQIAEPSAVDGLADLEIPDVIIE